METTKEQRDIFNEIINRITIEKKSNKISDSVFYMVGDSIYIIQDIKTNTFFIRYKDFFELFLLYNNDYIITRELLRGLIMEYTGLTDCILSVCGCKKLEWMEKHLKTIEGYYLINNLKSHLYGYSEEFHQILDGIFDEIARNPSTTPYYQVDIPHIDTIKKHITDLEIGDEVGILIPTVMNYIGKVTFINLEKQLIFLDGDEDEIGYPKLPDKDGCYDVYVKKTL